MRLTLIQLGINDRENKMQRLERVEKILDETAEADLIVLPELWNIGFFDFDNYHQLSENLQGETVNCLAAKARKKNAYILAGSIVEKAGEHFYNTCVLLSPQGKILSIYRKIHLYGYGSLEAKLLTPGQEIVTVDTAFGKVGITTCYDLRFPELYRRMVDQGVELFLIIAAWPYPRVEHWVHLNYARAIENQAYLISCNCAGTQKGIQFLGRSMVLDPWGVAVAAAGMHETIIQTKLDPHLVKAVRKEFPPLADRRLKI
jgi:predicted amidohydrolase